MADNKKLTAKQDAFVKSYLLNGGNATQAAIDAGYKADNAAVIGCENLIKPNIKAEIDKHQKKSDDSYVWTKSDKLKKLELIIEKATSDDKEKGMINMTAAIAAMKEHNLMQGDNAPTVTENTHVVKTFADMYGDT
jgi:phage terminase small subunit